MCRYLPAAKRWIDSQLMESWVKAVQDRTHMHAPLHGKQDEVLPALRRECAAAAERHAERATSDGRSHTHVAVAGMVLGTHKVLRAYVRNDAEVIEMLCEQTGGKSAAGVRCVFARSHLIAERAFWTSKVVALQGTR